MAAPNGALVARDCQLAWAGCLCFGSCHPLPFPVNLHAVRSGADHFRRPGGAIATNAKDEPTKDTLGGRFVAQLWRPSPIAAAILTIFGAMFGRWGIDGCRGKGTGVPSVRSIAQTGITIFCAGLIVIGLIFSLGPAGAGAILDQPGKPVRLISSNTSATAFFELNGDRLDLTVLFSELDDPSSIFRTRVSLVDGQSHTIVVGEPGHKNVRRFTSRRVGYTIETRLSPTATLTASMGLLD